MARKGILDPKGYYSPKWHSRFERVFLAQIGTRGLKGNLWSIILMTVSDRQPSMRLELFYWRLSLMACVNINVKTNQPPTVSVCLFDGMKVTVSNIFIIITPVQLTILFYHGRK